MRPRPSTPSWPERSARPSTRSGSTSRVRDPRGQASEFGRLVGDTAREFHALTNARVVRGRRLCLPGLTSTLPLGVDRAARPGAATRSGTSRIASR